MQNENFTPYKKRAIKFIELYHFDEWIIKIYSISASRNEIEEDVITDAKKNIKGWLHNKSNFPLDNYNIATLILHEGKEGVFAIISWWTDENMLQLHAYLADKESPYDYKLISDRGIISCVWEMEILWFERNAWIENILMKADQPDFKSYLNQQLNISA